MLTGLLLFLLNVGLVAVPIGGAVGTLGGIDLYRSQHGQQPLFSSDSGDTGAGGGGGNGYGSGGGSGGGGDVPDNFNYTANYTWPGSLPNATTTVNGVTFAKYCQQYVDILVGTKTGQNYTLNPNQWGWDYGDEGGMCLNVTTYSNMTYASNTTAPDWSVTWQYDPGPSTQPVHAFPNIMIDNSILPAKLGKLSVMKLDVQWAYEDLGAAVIGTIKTTSTGTAKKTTSTATTKGKTTATATTGTAKATTTASAATTAKETTAAGTTAAAATAAAVTSAGAKKARDDDHDAAAAAADVVFNVDERAIEERAIAQRATKQMTSLAERFVGGVTFSANVAVDMFFDKDPDKAGETDKATYEVMVWFAQFGNYTDPIGVDKGAVTSYVVDGANFTLYSGTNNNKQHVLTWVAETAASLFSGSLLSLITVLPQLDLDYYPSSTDYIGYFAFGSECYYSAENITFYVQNLAMEIE